MTAKVYQLFADVEPRKPKLVHCRDEAADHLERIVTEAYETGASIHTVEEYVAPGNMATACGQCGGVKGALEIYKGGALHGRHTNPCSCTGKKKRRSSLFTRPAGEP